MLIKFISSIETIKLLSDTLLRVPQSIVEIKKLLAKPNHYKVKIRSTIENTKR